MSIPSTTVTDRYIAAAVRTVPEQQRADLAAELRGSIDDQIDARTAQGEPRESAERAVLMELGDPDKLAAGYTDRPLQLIGPRYYLQWWRLLKLLLWIVPACAAFGVALAQTLSGASFATVVGNVVGIVFSVIVQLAFWVTLVFAIVERTGRGARDALVPWSLDQLPEPRERGADRRDMIAALVFPAIAAGVILWDRFVGWPVGGADRISFLAPGLWPWWIAGLLVLLALEAILAVTVYAHGHWTMPLAVVNAALNLAIAVPALWLLANGMLVNPEFFSTVLPDNGAEVAGILGVVLGFVFAGIAVWDSIDAFLAARRPADRG